MSGYASGGPSLMGIFSQLSRTRQQHVIENATSGTHSVTLNMQDMLHIRSSSGIRVDAVGKGARIILEDCTDVTLVFEKVISSVEAIRAVRCTVTGSAPLMTLDGCRDVDIAVSEEGDAPKLLSSASEGVRVHRAGQEYTVPTSTDMQQIRTLLENGAFVSSSIERSGPGGYFEWETK